MRWVELLRRRQDVRPGRREACTAGGQKGDVGPGTLRLTCTRSPEPMSSKSFVTALVGWWSGATP
jgi:hypothetical protein